MKGLSDMFLDIPYIDSNNVINNSGGKGVLMG